MDLNTFKALTLAPTPVQVGDFTFHVRCMTVGEQIAYSSALNDVNDHRWVFVLIRYTLCDEQGNLLFTGTTKEEVEQEIEVISKKPRLWISPLFDAALKANNMKFGESKEDEPSPQ